MNKKIWIGLVVIVFIGLSIFFLNKKKDSNEIQYSEINPTVGQLKISISSTGTIAPENRLEIKPPISGRIDKILIHEGDIVSKGQILAYLSSIERAALLDAARSKGTAELTKWEELYRPTPVISPMKGTIILKNFEEGQSFNNTDALFVLSDRLTVKAQVDETDIAQIKVGQKAHIILDAYPENIIDGEVSSVAFEATTINNVTNYIVNVAPITTPDFMRSGMTSNVIFFTKVLENVLLLPNTALLSENNEIFVLVKKNNKRSEKTHIEIGLTDGKTTQVISGVNENTIVFEPQIILNLEDKSSSSPFSPFKRKSTGKKNKGGHP